jgi:hypothetical protein
MATLTLIGIPVLLVAVVVIIILAIAWPYISRALTKTTGEPAEATILEKTMGKRKAYGSENALTAQEVILKLDVRPTGRAPYQAEIKFMAGVMEDMRLQPGYIVQVKIAKGNPNNIAVLAETSKPGPNASSAARAQVAMANLADQVSHGGKANAQNVMAAMQAEGVRSRPMVTPDDPKEKLEKLKEMLTAGLITQKEFETKKAEILSKM